MKKIIFHLVLFLIFFSSSLFFLFIHYTPKKSGFEENIKNFINAENERDIEKIIRKYEFPIKNYWGVKNLNKTELADKYRRRWNNTPYSHNYLLGIERKDSLKYLAQIGFKYRRLINDNFGYVYSEIEYILNSQGLITSIKNQKLKDIDESYLLQLILDSNKNKIEAPFRPKTLFLSGAFLFISLIFLMFIYPFDLKKIRLEEIRIKKQKEEFRFRIQEEAEKKKQEIIRKQREERARQEEFRFRIQEEAEKKKQEIIRKQREERARQEDLRQEEIRRKNLENLKKAREAKARKREEAKARKRETEIQREKQARIQREREEREREERVREASRIQREIEKKKIKKDEFLSNMDKYYVDEVDDDVEPENPLDQYFKEDL
jgi:hypothetical protein